MDKNLRLVLATSNKGKVKEISAFLKEFEIIPYSDLIEKFEIVEDGKTFQENANIKSKAVWNALKEKGFSEVVISDDSGISVEALDWRPNIFSARFAGAGSNDSQNRQKMINELKNLGVSESKAFYTASISIIDKSGEISTTHGWMHGKVIDKEIGDGGFGYDPIFIPNGENETLGVLPNEIKDQYSHRVKALKLAKLILEKLK
jgi:XTP/dITP diphosphohydrolase